LRRLRYERVKSVLVVQTGAYDQLAGIVERARASFPGGSVDVVVRGESARSGEELGADRVHVVQYSERAAALESLRRQSFDAILLQLGERGVRGLRTFPFQLRGRVLVAFNDSLDHFALNVFRTRDILRHLGIRRGRTDALLLPMIGAYLLVSALGIHARGWMRRRRRARVSRQSARARHAPEHAAEREEVRSGEVGA
jgi:hypothetical protein